MQVRIVGLLSFFFIVDYYVLHSAPLSLKSLNLIKLHDCAFGYRLSKDIYFIKLCYCYLLKLTQVWKKHNTNQFLHYHDGKQQRKPRIPNSWTYLQFGPPRSLSVKEDDRRATKILLTACLSDVGRFIVFFKVSSGKRAYQQLSSRTINK